MKGSHLTEQQLQDAVQKLPEDLELATHLAGCHHCQRQISAYQQVYRFIADSESPVLAFEPVDLLPVNFAKSRPVEKEESWFLPLVVAGIVLSVVAGLFMLGPYVHFIFTGDTSFALVIGSAVGILLMIAGLFELLNSYQRNLDLIDSESEQTNFNINISK